MINYDNKKLLILGKVMSMLVILFLLSDAIIHALAIAPVVKAFAGLGYPINLALPIAITELACLILYIIPRTSILGAILLTGYLGGAVASNLRVDYSLFGNILFPVYLGIILWGALYLREGRLRALVPFIK